MTRLSKLFVVTVLLVAVAAISATSAGASRRVMDRSKALGHSTLLRHADIGRPPVVGGPYGDPSDFPGASGSTVQSDSSSDSGQGSDDCLHQVVQPRTAC
jgi:hypothetical protein